MKALTVLLATSYFAHLGLCDLGVATTYKAPYLPNKCFGSNQAVIPSDRFFGALGPQMWDNGGNCGRHYQLRCVSAVFAGQCTGKTVTIVVIEGRLGNRAPQFSLSPEAADVIYKGGGRFNVEYQEVAK
uniref:Plant natriuretic peptide-like 7 n=1 Tax=Venturia pyrina TaxID=415593 RepID=A0A513ZS93_9PEZI|nr:plant natriuretic peptide-like 7 [Venturia pyrina]